MSDMDKYELGVDYKVYDSEFETTEQWIEAVANGNQCDADVMALLRQRDEARKELAELKISSTLQIAHYQVELDEAEAENARLRAALAKYADPENWRNVFYGQQWIGDGDGPDIARDALAGGDKK